MTPQANKLLDDCFAHDRKRLRHAEALAILKERVRPVVGVERVALSGAAGRILATAAVAPRSVPAHTNAAVDGFSFAAADYDAASGAQLAVEGRAAAGHPLEAKPGPGRRRASSPVQSCQRATRWSYRGRAHQQ
jgi:molybdopterin molybdotransferase